MNIPEHSRCPGCSGNMVFGIAEQALVCESCGTVITIPKYDDIVLEKAKHNVNLTEAADRIIEQREKRESFKRSYACRSCGGLIQPGALGASDACPFCGNSIVFTDKIRDQSEPDFLIPFKKDRTFFLEAFHKILQESLFVPEDFANTAKPENIHACYIPFWIYDARVSDSVTMKTEQVTGNLHLFFHNVYDCMGSASLTFQGVPQDGSQEIPAAVTQSPEPYHPEAGVPFHFGYLSGLDARIFDINAKGSYPAVKARVIASSRKFIAGENCDNIHVVNEDAEVSSTEISYALYPIWTMKASWQGKTYNYAMNGETGRLTGDIPADRKRMLGISLIFGIVCALPLILRDLYLAPLDLGDVARFYDEYMSKLYTVIPFLAVITGEMLPLGYFRFVTNKRYYLFLKIAAGLTLALMAYLVLTCIIKDNLWVLRSSMSLYLTGPALAAFLAYAALLHRVRRQRRKREIALREDANAYLNKAESKTLSRSATYLSTYVSMKRKMSWPLPPFSFGFIPPRRGLRRGPSGRDDDF